MYRHVLSSCFRTLLFMAVCAGFSAAQAATPAGDTASFEKSSFPAKDSHSTLLQVPKAGRYSIRVKSGQGTALELFDRMAGPCGQDGEAGKTDGRIDMLLDRGTYKVRIQSHPEGSGEAKLEVHGFREQQQAAAPPDLPVLKPLELYSGTLADLEQRSWWIHMPKRETLRVEIMGRSLADCRLWKDGSWLDDATPDITVYEPSPGKPMTRAEFHHSLEPGLYLLTCYGGPPQKWGKDSPDMPLYVRMGAPDIGDSGQLIFTVSPFGRDIFRISTNTNFMQLYSPDRRPAQLMLRSWGETSSMIDYSGDNASITKELRDPWCMLRNNPYTKNPWLIVKAEPGTRLELGYFEQKYFYTIEKNKGDYWIAAMQSAAGRDALELTAIMTDSIGKTALQSRVIPVGPEHPLVRRVNMLGQSSLHLFIESEGTYTIKEDKAGGAVCTYQIKPFMSSVPSNYQPPPFQASGTDFELVKGYYELTINPQSKGILHFALAEKKIFSDDLLSKEAPAIDAARTILWPKVALSGDEWYTVFCNQRFGVETGFIVRKLPMALDSPLPVELASGQSVPLRIEVKKRSILDVQGGSHSLKINGQQATGKIIEPGTISLDLASTETEPKLFTLHTTPAEPPPKPVVKKLEEAFPHLTAGAPVYADFGRLEKKQFLLTVEKPGLCRLETSGRMAMQIAVRTPLATSLFSESRNGIGRNALIQQYLKPGLYLVSVETLGQSQGRAGIHLRYSPMVDTEPLTAGTASRQRVAADSGVRYRLDIAEAGQYKVETLGLGKGFACRLEDDRGFPFTRDGEQGPVTMDLEPGTYYYYSLPKPFATRRITLLQKITEQAAISGKGPHSLRLNEPLDNIWMEAPGRPPDVYTVQMTAPAQVELRVPQNMIATVSAVGGSQVAETIRGVWSGELAMGAYEIRVKTRDENNRLPYTISLTTTDLVPGLRYSISSLPATLKVSVGKQQFLDFTSFGKTDVKASLWDESGKERIAENDDDGDDWNFRISRRLDSGRYELRLAAVSFKKEQRRPSWYQEGSEESEESSGGYDEDGSYHYGRRPEPPAAVAFDAAMSAREEKTLEGGELPRTIKEKLGSQVLTIPFATRGDDELVHIACSGVEGVSMALLSDEGMLAEAVGELFIPLPAKKQYRLMLWRQGRGEAGLTVQIAACMTDDIKIKNRLQRTDAIEAARIENPDYLCCRFSADGALLLYSAGLERPCLPVGDNTVGTKDAAGWLVASQAAEIALKPLQLEAGSTAHVALSDIPVSFSVERAKDDAALLLEAESVGSLIGAKVCPEGDAKFGEFAWQGTLIEPSHTLVGIPAGQICDAAVWLTRPLRHILSARESDNTLEQVTLHLTAYPQQAKLDFKKEQSLEYTVEPGRSVSITLDDDLQVLNAVLARGLAAFCWYKDRPFAMAVALQENTGELMAVQGGKLIVVNRGTASALFRLEKQKGEQVLSPKYDQKKGFEKVCAYGGTMRFSIDAAGPLYAAGGSVKARFLRSDGMLVEREIASETRPFVTFDDGKGILELRHGAGLVKVWQAPAGQRETSFMGRLKDADSASFDNDAGALKDKAQLWRFSLDAPTFVIAETAVSGAMAFVIGETAVDVSLGASAGMRRMARYLPAGEFRLWTRPLQGRPAQGELRLTKIKPAVLDDKKEEGLRLIQPGQMHAYSFTVATATTVGCGVKTESDQLKGSLFDSASQLIATGGLVYKKLEPGQYVFVVEGGAQPVQYRPVLLGASGSRQDVPDDTLKQYMEQQGQ